MASADRRALQKSLTLIEPPPPGPVPVPEPGPVPPPESPVSFGALLLEEQAIKPRTAADAIATFITVSM
jgi:hypothetical protein